MAVRFRAINGAGQCDKRRVRAQEGTSTLRRKASLAGPALDETSHKAQLRPLPSHLILRTTRADSRFILRNLTLVFANLSNSLSIPSKLIFHETLSSRTITELLSAKEVVSPRHGVGRIRDGATRIDLMIEQNGIRVLSGVARRAV